MTVSRLDASITRAVATADQPRERILNLLRVECACTSTPVRSARLGA